MKKNVLILFVLVAFGASVFAADAEHGKDLFGGFEAVELSSEEAKRVTGGETYVFYKHVAFGKNHTGIVQTDKPLSEPDAKVNKVIEYGPENGSSRYSSGVVSGFNGGGNNVRQDYEKDRKYKVSEHPEKYHLQEVAPPEGKSVAEFDEDVRKAADAFDRNQKEYSVSNNSCNTATSTIIKDAGGSVTPTKSVPGWKK